MHRLWSIPELLTQVILFLDLKDFEDCFIVCRLWRNALKNALPPFQRPLPDRLLSKRPPEILRKAVHHALPAYIREYARAASQHEEQWANLARFTSPGDDYFFWQEGAYANALEMIRPYLNPFLSKYAYHLISGLEAITQGHMGVHLHTKCSLKELSDLINDGATEDLDQLLVQPPCASVQVFVGQGAAWDTTFAQFCGEERSTRIKVDRERGVRLGDVVDEMRGCLVPRVNEATDIVVLEWRFHETSR